MFASGALDKLVIIWDLNLRRMITKLIGHTYPVDSVAFSPDGALVISGSADLTINLWVLVRTLRVHPLVAFDLRVLFLGVRILDHILRVHVSGVLVWGIVESSCFESSCF